MSQWEPREGGGFPWVESWIQKRASPHSKYCVPSWGTGRHLTHFTCCSASRGDQAPLSAGGAWPPAGREGGAAPGQPRSYFPTALSGKGGIVPQDPRLAAALRTPCHQKLCSTQNVIITGPWRPTVTWSAANRAPGAAQQPGCQFRESGEDSSAAPGLGWCRTGVPGI